MVVWSFADWWSDNMYSIQDYTVMSNEVKRDIRSFHLSSIIARPDLQLSLPGLHHHPFQPSFLVFFVLPYPYHTLLPRTRHMFSPRSNDSTLMNTSATGRPRRPILLTKPEPIPITTCHQDVRGRRVEHDGMA